MLLPVIFNFKHGMELYLKALIMYFHINEEYPLTHDLFVLFGELKKNSKVYSSLLDNKFEQIINKYYFGLYYFADDECCPDINNEAERYPEYQNKNCYKVDDLVGIDDYNKLLIQIKDDIIEAQRIFREEIYKKLS